MMLRIPLRYLAAAILVSPLVHYLDVVSIPATRAAKSPKPRNATAKNVFQQIASSQIDENKKSNTKKDNDAAFAIEAQRAKASFRYVEAVAPGLNLEMDLFQVLHSSTSAVQSVQVIDSYFGRTLVTDGKTQSAEHDEFVYHESLVHPALFWSAYLSRRSGSSAPKSVFIGGGGELATAREVLKHNTIERVVMVDIDPDVIEVSKK